MKNDLLELTRRGFLRLGLGAGAAMLTADWTRVVMAGETGTVGGRGKSMILVWLGGGPSHLDTFDPKSGVDTAGPFQAIPTAVPGIRLSENFPLLAQEMKSVCLLRGMSSQEGSHDRARYLVQTGYMPTGSVTHPSFGAYVSAEKGADTDPLPNNVSILGGGGPGSSFLGKTHAPFNVRDIRNPLENVGLPSGVDADRFADRNDLLEYLDESFATRGSGVEAEGHQRVYQKAMQLMQTPKLEAFDLERESDKVRRAYGYGVALEGQGGGGGRRGQQTGEDYYSFGQGCLMARRLVENGVRFVTVNLGGWDTHQDNFTRVKNVSQILDPGLSSLIRDLRERGLLESTLVACMGEFGRTPRINPQEGRDHYPRAWSALLAGCGTKSGFVHGSTNETGEEVAEGKVGVPNLIATFCRALEIDPAKQYFSKEGRPLKIANGGEPVAEVFA